MDLVPTPQFRALLGGFSSSSGLLALALALPAALAFALALAAFPRALTRGSLRFCEVHGAFGRFGLAGREDKGYRRSYPLQLVLFFRGLFCMNLRWQPLFDSKLKLR